MFSIKDYVNYVSVGISSRLTIELDMHPSLQPCPTMIT